MPFAVFALAAINFAIGTQGFAFAGLLPELAADLGVTIGEAGVLVAATSITFALAAPLAAALVAGIERRQVILAALACLTVINALCALAPTFEGLVALRILAGLASAFVGALATVAAAALVPPRQRGRAFSVVMGGLTVAFVLGVPIGSVIGGAFGWRATFLFAALATLLATALIAVTVPKIEPADGTRPKFRDVFRDAGILRVLALSLLSFSATFTVVAFIGPVITAATGAKGGGIGALQAFIGIGSVAGLAAGGFLADSGRSGMATTGAFAIMCLSLAAYWFVLSAPQHSVPMPAMALLIFVGATALFALIPINLARLAATAGAAAPIAFALNGSLVSLGQGIGALWGGLLSDALGVAAIGPGGAAIALIGLILAQRLHDPVRRHAA